MVGMKRESHDGRSTNCRTDDGHDNAAYVQHDRDHQQQQRPSTAAGVKKSQRPRQRIPEKDAFQNDGFDLGDEKSVTPPPPYPPACNDDQQPQVDPALVSPMMLEDAKTKHADRRGTWGNPLEFLMSCIAMSVGLGNVWRFPYTAYKNGGGAFLIPYLIVLLFIGKPLYFFEMAMGQFSSYGSVKVWEMVPILKGVGYAQAMATWFVGTYYCVLIAITIYYFLSSFQSVLPWTVCNPAWSSFAECYNSSSSSGTPKLNASELLNASAEFKSSSSIYFTEEVMKTIDNIDDGIGYPDWRLSLCLLLAWLIIMLVQIKGVASSGKVAYFTALFPYAILVTLLVRGVTLDGAATGILYYVRPDWSKLLDGSTWYAAVTQCFFSLSVGFGPIVTFSSYNPFKHNIYRDAVIISLMDSFTSFLAGITIFAILGNLAHESGKDIADVVSAGTGLAFVSYPDAISKFEYLPQLFAVLFFLMLLTLGIGSSVSLVGCVVTVICDAFPRFKRWAVVVTVCLVGFTCGLIYVTPGGMMVLDIVDYFGGGYIIFLMATIETIGVCWIYGLNRFVRDIEFMLNIRLSAYWKLTWAYVIPAVLVFIFAYAMSLYKPLGQGDYVYPTKAIAAGWCLAAMAVLQVPIWALYVISKQPQDTWFKRLVSSLRETEHWGPKVPAYHVEWLKWQKEKPHHHTSYSARLWYPKIASRMRYNVSTLARNNNNSPSKDMNRQVHKVVSAKHSKSAWGHIENEIAS